ncbi:MAG: hypothetical protein C5S49_05305 [Candidatus Methanogaster sp.]|nr:MAG: hypothetical protein C5S49_05305 [ANME-2 cluster archaeon]
MDIDFTGITKEPNILRENLYPNLKPHIESAARPGVGIYLSGFFYQNLTLIGQLFHRPNNHVLKRFNDRNRDKTIKYAIETI